MAEPEARPEPPKEVEENVELQPPLIYKTWTLKVSIHCEACKRKVKRVLKDVEGVYETDIDLKQQKVVVKGNVESETLIKKLLKTGKHAELWPEKSDSKGKKKGKSKKKEKHRDSESSDGSSGNEDEKEKVKNEDAAGKISDDDAGQPKQPGTAPPGDGGAKKKKKKKKKKSGGGGGGNAGGEAPGDAPANGAPPPGPIHGHPEPGPHPVPGPHPIIANESPPRHFVTQYPPHYFTHPLYSVRYSTAYAACSQPQRESYYATPQQYSFAYVHPGVRPEFDPPPSDYEPYSSQSSDSLAIFSDENPNGCSIV